MNNYELPDLKTGRKVPILKHLRPWVQYDIHWHHLYEDAHLFNSIKCRSWVHNLWHSSNFPSETRH